MNPEELIEDDPELEGAVSIDWDEDTLELDWDDGDAESVARELGIVTSEL